MITNYLSEIRDSHLLARHSQSWFLTWEELWSLASSIYSTLPLLMLHGMTCQKEDKTVSKASIQKRYLIDCRPFPNAYSIRCSLPWILIILHNPQILIAHASLLGASSNTVSLSPWCLMEERVRKQTSINFVQDHLHGSRRITCFASQDGPKSLSSNLCV